MDNSNLEKILREYKELTLNIMSEIQQEGDFNSLFSEREEILKKIKNSDFNRENLKKIYISLELQQLEDDLKLLIKNKQAEIKKEMINIGKNKRANMNYNSLKATRNTFNKTI